MTSKRYFALAAVLVCLGLNRQARSEESDEYRIQGMIQAVDPEGRLRVSGRTITVDDDTEITDNTNREATRQELHAGIEVDITYEMNAKGDHAKKLIATMLR